LAPSCQAVNKHSEAKDRTVASGAFSGAAQFGKVYWVRSEDVPVQRERAWESKIGIITAMNPAVYFTHGRGMELGFG
jgi:hypothetical protein